MHSVRLEPTKMDLDRHADHLPSHRGRRIVELDIGIELSTILLLYCFEQKNLSARIYDLDTRYLID